MTMSPSPRRAALALHVITSVGWIGAAAGYLALGVSAATSEEPLTIRAAWIGMEVIAWYAVIPLGGLALLSGLVMSLGTSWGLVRHYWVLFAFVLTVLALIVLILHMPAVVAGAALARTGDDSAVMALGGDVLHPALGLVVLVVVAVLNVFKPRGATGFGRQRHRQSTTSATRAV